MSLTNKKIVVSTICETEWIEKSGLNKMLASLKYFNPEIEVLVYDEKELERLYQNYPPGVNIFAIMGETMRDAKQKLGADITVHIDADSIILAPISDLIQGDFDIWGCRNDPTEFFKVGRDESMNRPYTIRNIPNNLYMNCGFIGCSSDSFLNDWINYNKYLINKYGDIRNATECPIVEQGSYNLIAYYNNKYKIKLLDPENGGFYCGPSANFRTGNNHCPEYLKQEYNGNNWESWYDIYEKGGESFINNKQVKILHQAGGGQSKLRFDMFNYEYKKYLTKITGYDR